MLWSSIWVALFLFFAAVGANLVDDIVSALKHAVDCGSCHALLIPVKGLAALGDSSFVNTFNAVCKTLKLQDDDVCEGAIGQQAPILAHNLRSISTSGQMGSKLCDAVFGLCQPPAVNPYTVQFPKSAPANPKVWKSTEKAPFQVAHFSDVHIDRDYTTGTEANCNKPICCRNFGNNTGPINTPAGPNGNPKCDTPVPLADAMLSAIEQHAPNNKFSIFTGDVIEAAVWLVTESEATSDLQSFNQQMAAKLHTPVYPAIGNHESAPVNDFPRNTTSGVSVQWIFDTQSKGWAQWIGNAAANQVAHFSGSYSIVVPGTNLRIISLNTVYWYKMNFYLYDRTDAQPDPNGIIAFAVQELQAAEDAGQRAWIIGHMPPGRQDTLNDQSNYFDQVIQRYHNTIAGQFYGHDHSDQFAIAYSDYSQRTAANAVSMAWIAPALTPRSGNPAFKIYDIDPDTYEVMDAHTYISDMSSSAFQTQAPTFQPYYAARSAYGPLVPSLTSSSSLNAAFWHGVTEAFEKNNTAFQMYNTFQTRGVRVRQCDDECRTRTICNLRALRAENNCDDSKPGFDFRRRSLQSREDSHDHCDGGLGHIFSHIAERIAEPDSDMKLDLLKKQLEEIIHG